MGRALGWSIGVVLVAGVLAVVTIPAPQDLTPLRQRAGALAPDEQAGPGTTGGPATPDGVVAAQASVPGQGGAAASVTAGASPPSSAAEAAKPKASAAPKPAPKAAPTSVAAAAAPRLQPAPGRYPLRISGTSSVGSVAAAVPSSGSLIVESRGGRQVHRTVGVPGDLVLVQQATAQGVDLVSFSLTAGSATLSFSPPAPLPFVRTEPGSWSWSVQSGDRSVTLSQTSTVTSAGTVNVGGTQVPAVTVRRVFTVSGANVSGTVQLTTTVSLADRLPLIQHQVINVTGKAFGGLVSKVVKSDSTATLTSTSPR